MLLKETRKIDSKGRIILPPPLLRQCKLKPGDVVFFESTKSGSIIIRKDKSDEQQK